MIELQLTSPLLRTPTVFAEAIRRTLDAVVWLNEQTLRKWPQIPDLYKSGVYFQPEPPGTESIVDLVQVLRTGHGDCAHLCAWRIAELRVRENVQATCRLVWLIRKDVRSYHVMVRFPDGTVEDPSKVLGMGHSEPVQTFLRNRPAHALKG
jgi:hypothetical protein